MRKNKKFFILISIAAITILFIPIGVVVAAQISGSNRLNLGRIAPPVMTVDNEQEPVLLDPYAASGKKLFDDAEKDHCLGYLDYYKVEIVTGNESAKEAERITRKNTLIQKYKAYVDRLYNQVMTIEEYEAHYDHLMNMDREILPLEPEKTPEEQFEIDIRCLLLKLEEDLYYSEVHGEEYINNKKINVTKLKQSIEELTSLQKNFNSKKLTFERTQHEYAICIENIKTASPNVYASLAADEKNKVE